MFVCSALNLIFRTRVSRSSLSVQHWLFGRRVGLGAGMAPPELVSNDCITDAGNTLPMSPWHTLSGTCWLHIVTVCLRAFSGRGHLPSLCLEQDSVDGSGGPAS